MEKEFVTYEQALALMELGFDEECLKYYTEEYGTFVVSDDYDGGHFVLAPLKQQVFRWFREKHGIDYYITSRLPHVTGGGYNTVIDDIWWPHLVRDTYEEAENALIDKLIELAKQQEKWKIKFGMQY